MGDTKNPPWAEKTKDKIESDGIYADYNAWEEWIKLKEEYDMFADFESTEMAHLYGMFTDCFPDYKWDF